MENLKAIKKLNLFKNLEENEITALLRCFNVKILKTTENNVNFLLTIQWITGIMLRSTSVDKSLPLPQRGGH